MSGMKKQHYVPQFYLRNFSENLYFNTYLINKSKLLIKIPIKGQCQLNNYYDKGDDKTWEINLSQLENEWSHAIRVANNSMSEDDIDDSTKQSLVSFGLVQVMRSTLARDSYLSRSWDTLKVSLLMENNNISEQELNSQKDYHYKNNNNVPATLLDMLKSLLPLIKDLEVKIIKYDCEETLLSSDNPVLMTNRLYPSVGFAIAGLMYIFPISGSTLVVVYDHKIYQNKESFVISTNRKEIRELNKLQLINANQIVFGLDAYSFNSIDRLSSLVRDKRTSHLKNVLGTNKLGSNTQKLIVLPNYGLKINVLSFNKFTKLGHNMNRLGIKSTDWFPRKLELFPEYKDRIKMRLNLNKVFNSVPDLKRFELDIAKIKKFNSLMKEYWDTK